MTRHKETTLAVKRRSQHVRRRQPGELVVDQRRLAVEAERGGENLAVAGLQGTKG